MKRLFGSIKNLELISRNSTCDYYRLTLYCRDNYDGWETLTAEGGFLYYTKKEIYKKLKQKIIEENEKVLRSY